MSLRDAYLAVYKNLNENTVNPATDTRSKSKPLGAVTSVETIKPAETPKPSPTLDDLRQASARATMSGPSKEAQALMSSRTKNILSGNSVYSRGAGREDMISNNLRRASRTDIGDKLKAGIAGQEKVQQIRREVGKPIEAPKSPITPAVRDPFKDGGGEAKMKATGMTRDQVIELGKKNAAKLPQQTPATTPPPQTFKTATKPTNPTEIPKVVRTSTKLTPEQIKALRGKRNTTISPLSQQNESFIMNYLIEEGYAETSEAAEVIMANMSEEWRQSIVDEAVAD